MVSLGTGELMLESVFQYKSMVTLDPHRIASHKAA
jgi:hypothetical protein